MNISAKKAMILLASIVGYGTFMYLLNEAGYISDGGFLFPTFLVSVGLLYYYHVEEPNNFFSYYEDHKKITNWNKSVLFVYAKLIEIDGNVSQKELALVKRILKKDMADNYMPEHYLFLKSSLGVTAEIRHPLRDIFENFGSSYCMLFMSNLVRLAATDGLMTEKEELFILNIAKQLKIGKRAYNSILERHSFITEAEWKRKSSAPKMKFTSSSRAYKVLGISNNASFEEIKKAYRDLVKIHHPDKIRSKALKQSAKQQFQVIQEAYETIKKEKG